MSTNVLDGSSAATKVGRHQVGGRHQGKPRLSVLRENAGMLWASMDNRDVGRRVPGTGAVAIAAMLLQTAVAVVCITSGASLWYSDALSHLVISGRITSGFNSGVQQLGTVWLPAPHLIMAPFTANTWLWSTGWAAAIVGIFSMGVATAALYRICARLGLGRAGRLLAVIAFTSNATVLYVYSTALTEPVLLTSLLACIAGLAHYATAKRPLSGGEIAVFAGLPAAIAVLSRYEGWVLVLSGVLFIILIEWGRRSSLRVVLASTSFLLPLMLAITVLPMLAIGWWLGYNLANFGNPLEFVYGEFSAFAQQERIADTGTLNTRGNLAISLTVLGGAVWQIATPTIVIFGLIGFVYMVSANGVDTRLLVAGVLFSPFAFNIVALYLGQTTMRNDFSMPTGVFNVRYALTAIPFLVFCIGLLADAISSNRYSREFLGQFGRVGIPVLMTLALLAQGAYVASDIVQRSPVIAEGKLNSSIRSSADPVWDYLIENYDGTSILMDEVTNVLRPQAGIPLGDYYILAA